MPTPLESINEKQFMDLFDSILDKLMETYLKNDDNKKRTKLMNQLRDHVKMHGHVVYNTVQSQFTYDIIQALENQDIPYVSVPDISGNLMIIVKEKDSQKFLEIQQNVSLLTTDYAKELTPETILNLYKVHGGKDVDTLSFADPNMALIAEKKLYASGITFAKIEENDGTIKFLISPFSKFSTKGDDLCNFELMHAFEQSKMDPVFTQKGVNLMNLRIQQADWDQSQIRDFIAHIKAGDNYVFAPLYGQVNSYVECRDFGATLLERDDEAEDGWKRTEIKISPDASDREIEIALSKAVAPIQNGSSINASKFDPNIQLLKKSYMDDKSKIMLLRPEGESAEKTFENFNNRDVKPMLEAINNVATKQVNAKANINFMTQEQAYRYKKEIIANILDKRDLPEIQDFLDSNKNGMSQADRKTWLDNFENHFTNTQEKTNNYECVVGKESTATLKRRLDKAMENNMSKNRNQDKAEDIKEKDQEN